MRLTAIVAVLACSAVALAQTGRPEPSDDKILFEGPAPGEVSFARPGETGGTKLKGTILFVGTDGIYLRRDGGGVEVIDARRYTIKYAVAAIDGKQKTWESDPTTKQIKGYTAPVRQPDLPATSVSSGSEAKYLFFSLERLQERIDQAILTNDEQLLKHLKDRAARLRDHAATVPGAAPVVVLFDGLAKYADAQTKLTEERAEFLDKHMEKVEQNRIKDREAVFRSESTQLSGLADYYKGALPKVTVWGYRRGAAVRASYDLGGAMAGVTNIVRGQQQYELDRMQIKFASDLLDKEKAKTLNEYADRQNQMRLDRRKVIAGVGESAFKLPRVQDVMESRDLAYLFQTKGDYRSLLNELEKRTGNEKQADNSPNPFTVLDSYHTAAQLKEADAATQSAKLFDLARQAADAVKFVPAGELYDPDRADVLQSAAALACMAAMLESPTGTWRNSYSPKAAFAVRLLDRGKQFTIDKSGELREQKAVALGLTGRMAEGLKLAEEIRGLRDGSVSFLLTLTRLLALNDRGKDGLNVLEDAVTKRGFRDVQFVTQNDDFTGLRLNSGRFAALAIPQIGVVHVVPKTVGALASKHRFEITNNSTFTLTDVRITVTADVRGQQRPLTFLAQVPQLEKGEKHEIQDTFANPANQVTRVVVTVASDQGKAVVTNPPRK